MISVRFQGKPFNITVIQVYAPTTNAKEAEFEGFYEDLQDLTLTPKKDVLMIGDWNAKVGSQEIPGVASKFGLGVQNKAGPKANRVLPREHTGHGKHPLQHKRRFNTGTSPDDQYQNQFDYILRTQR